MKCLSENELVRSNLAKKFPFLELMELNIKPTQECVSFMCTNPEMARNFENGLKNLGIDCMGGGGTTYVELDSNSFDSFMKIFGQTPEEDFEEGRKFKN